jgi:tetratricopeptide (TPR) repeat protein
MHSVQARTWRPIAPLLLLGLVLLTTGHRFANDFVFDDLFVIRDGEVIHDASRIPDVFVNHTFVVSSSDQLDGVMPVDTYRPLTLLTFFWDSALGGRSPWAYHLTNLLLHLLCVLLLYRVTLRLCGDEHWTFALFGTAVFALNPWTAGAHVWINGRSDLCALAFALSGLLLVLRGPGQRPWLRSFSLFFLFLCALLSKEVILGAAPAIALAPLLRSTDAQTPPLKRLRPAAVPLAAASVLYLCVRHAVLGGLRTHDDASMLWLAVQRLPILLLDGLQAAFIPREAYLRNLSDEYAVLPAWVSAVAAIGLLVTAGLCWRLRRRWPVLPWAALWYGGTLAPVAIITTLLWPGFGRYLYVPSAAVAWVTATGLGKLWPLLRPNLRPVSIGAGLIYLLAAAFFLVRHTASYRNETTLYTHAIEMNPDAAYGWGFLGLSLKREGLDQEAVTVMREALARAPEEHRYRARLAHALIDVGQRDEARELASKGIAEFDGTPRGATFHLALARSLPSRDPARVVFHLVRCLELWPGRLDCENALRQLVTAAPDAADNRAALEALLQQPERQPFRARIECGALERCDPASSRASADLSPKH